MFKIFTLFADLIANAIFGEGSVSGLKEAVHFFIEDVSKILTLLAVMIFIISFLRASLDIERVRRFLNGKSKWAGYFFASVFGAVTPFCSCSGIPLFLGFTSAGIPLGITMSFLITSPMINEVAVVLLGSILGIKFTLLYIALGITSGILGGAIIDAIKADRYLTPLGSTASGTNIGPGRTERIRLTLKDRSKFAWEELTTIFKRVWKWVIIGVGLGAALHGFVPADFIYKNLSGEFWSVPAAVAVGIPLYSNATGIIPAIESLLDKGLPIGTALAFMMSVVAASFPEFVMLKQVMKPKLLVIFFIILLSFFTLAGWIFNLVF